jgi:hypothetical protein
LDASIGRIAGLQGSPREGPESAPQASFHRQRETSLTALSGRSVSRKISKKSGTRGFWQALSSFAFDAAKLVQEAHFDGIFLSSTSMKGSSPREARRRARRSSFRQSGQVHAFDDALSLVDGRELPDPIMRDPD